MASLYTGLAGGGAAVVVALDLGSPTPQARDARSERWSDHLESLRIRTRGDRALNSFVHGICGLGLRLSVRMSVNGGLLDWDKRASLGGER